MVMRQGYLKRAVAALVFAALLPAGAEADEDELEALFEGLRGADAEAAVQIEQRIYEIWSQSGSPSMDLLLERGREAMAEGDTQKAVRHFSALIDHAPGFAEGYNGRATAYFHDQKFGQALDDIARTLDLNPRHFGALSGLAIILEQIGMDEGALAAWRAVEEFHPTREGLAEAVRRLQWRVEGQTL